MTYQEKLIVAKLEEKQSKETLIGSICAIAMVLFMLFSGLFNECSALEFKKHKIINPTPDTTINSQGQIVQK